MDVNDALNLLTAGFSLIVGILFWIIGIVGRWKVFEKAGKAGWKSLIPFYSGYCLFDIAMGTGWLYILTFIPFIGLVVSVILAVNLARAFGCGTIMAILIFIFQDVMLIPLGFGNYQYQGPVHR
ncbi:MAG TPA: hypothetical protein IAA51_08580 [Candidatus Cottocaccamicrobium excrementipullorum]|nr:hypothetical protein [Candidatus Cottocaccamicrobium excrementipullorum]